MSTEPDELDTSRIKNWRSIVTLIVFVFTNIIILFPFHITVFIPRHLSNAILDLLSALRIIPPRENHDRCNYTDPGHRHTFVRLNFPMNYVTGPLIAVLFLLAILAIGRKEVHDGTLGFGADSISPIAIIAVFMTLAYITLSINVSGITRYSALKVLQREGGVGHRLFFYVYTFLFGIGSFIGNDFIILSGTAFLAYFTRCLTNIMHPRAWIYTQFAITKIASAILVSSNPTNLILASAFNIKFIHYAANMIVPVVATVIVLFPCLLYIIFADENLIPLSIRMHELFEGARGRQPVSPNIPNARGIAGGENNIVDRFEEDMNPFLDKVGAAFGAIIVAAMLVTLLAVNGASQSASEYPVYWVTLPAAFVLFCWDIASGWYCRKETREIARKRREEIERFRDEITIQIPIREGERANGEEEESRRTAPEQGGRDTRVLPSHVPTFFVSENVGDLILSSSSPGEEMNGKQDVHEEKREVDEEQEMQRREKLSREMALRQGRRNGKGPRKSTGRRKGRERRKSRERRERRERRESMEPRERKGRNTTLVSLLTELHWWCQGTFPTATFVVTQLPFALAPFALSMFVLDQALITKGWAALLAYGWDHWVKSTGTVGAVGGMGFLSVILCNFAGTNIGTTFLLCRVIQAWQTIHQRNGIPISNRTFWATVYSMALGVNYGAFSMAFSASLGGFLWRDILLRNNVLVRRLDFLRVNLPIIAVAMAVGCATLVIEVYIVRGNNPYDS